MSKIKPKPSKSPSKATTAKAASDSERKLVKREIQPAYTKGMKVQITPEMARKAVAEVMKKRKAVKAD